MVWRYTPIQLKAWLELIERDEIRERADLMETVFIASSGGDKKTNKAIQDAIKKLRENV